LHRFYAVPNRFGLLLTLSFIYKNPTLWRQMSKHKGLRLFLSIVFDLSRQRRLSNNSSTNVDSGGPGTKLGTPKALTNASPGSERSNTLGKAIKTG